MRNDGKPERPVEGEELRRWLDGQPDRALTDQAWELLAWHLQPTGLFAGRSVFEQQPLGWEPWCWYATRALFRPLAARVYDAVLRALLADLVGLASSVPASEGDLARRLFPLLVAHADGASLPERLLELLPPSTRELRPAWQALLDEHDRQEKAREAQAWRDDSYGY